VNQTSKHQLTFLQNYKTPLSHWCLSTIHSTVRCWSIAQWH